MEQEATVTIACSTSVANTTSFSTTTTSIAANSLSTAATTFPLTSKRLKLSYMKQLAEVLRLPTSATGSDLLVMIAGKLRETDRDPTNIQVVVTHKEDGEELSLQDMNGVFLHFIVPVSSLSVSLDNLVNMTSRSNPLRKPQE